MKKIIALSFIAACSLIFANCSSTKPAASSASKSNTPPSPEATIAELKKKYTDAQMAEGKTISESKCNKCHSLIPPEDRTVVQWQKILPVMVQKAKLTENETEVVRAYIISNSKAS